MSNRDHLTLSLLPPEAGEGSLLERLLALGLAVPFGCRNGNCWHCRARLHAGSVQSAGQATAMLATDEILLCRARAAGPVTLALDCGAALQMLPCERCGRSSQTLQLRWAAGRRRVPKPGQSVTLVAGARPAAARVTAIDAASRRLTVTLDDTITLADGITAKLYFTADDSRPQPRPAPGR